MTLEHSYIFFLTTFFLFGYFIGSIPFGLILTKISGLGDIRDIGSGNIGATNVLRTGNKKLALLTLILDGIKGALAIYLVKLSLNYIPFTFSNDIKSFEAVVAISAVIGHCFPIWLCFKGGTKRLRPARHLYNVFRWYRISDPITGIKWNWPK